MPPFDVAAFRVSFQEFADEVAYPNQFINMWVGLASAMVNYNVWKTQYTLGVSLYVAHELVLSAQNTKTAQAGGPPGVTGGIANTKTVGSVTVGYDTTSTAEENAGYWNTSNYGKQFIRLARVFGAGAIQINGSRGGFYGGGGGFQ